MHIRLLISCIISRKITQNTKKWHFYLQVSVFFCNFAIEFAKATKKETKTMARPIKETPTLYGEDARRFEYAVKHPRKVSAEEMRKMDEGYQRMMSIIDFAF